MLGENAVNEKKKSPHDDFSHEEAERYASILPPACQWGWMGAGWAGAALMRRNLDWAGKLTLLGVLCGGISHLLGAGQAPTLVLGFLLISQAAIGWTSLVIWRELLEGNSQIQLTEVVGCWVARLPALFGLFLLYLLAAELGILLLDPVLSQSCHSWIWLELWGFLCNAIPASCLLWGILALPEVLLEGALPIQAVFRAGKLSGGFRRLVWVFLGYHLIVLMVLFLAVSSTNFFLFQLLANPVRWTFSPWRSLPLLTLGSLLLTWGQASWVCFHLQRKDPPQDPALGISDLFVGIALVIPLFIAVMPTPFSRGHQRANVRACYANLKTIAGAVEMYNLDFDAEVKEIDPEFLKTLQTEGYLQQVPKCPENAVIGRRNYYLLPRPSEDWHVGFCLRHGFISREGPRLSPREQLRKTGITEGALFDQAYAYLPEVRFFHYRGATSRDWATYFWTGGGNVLYQPGILQWLTFL
jgi:competence protein ComGC